jgi:hypothetical protein
MEDMFRIKACYLCWIKELANLQEDCRRIADYFLPIDRSIIPRSFYWPRKGHNTGIHKKLGVIQDEYCTNDCGRSK